jgi:hypothetical protein
MTQQSLMRDIQSHASGKHIMCHVSIGTLCDTFRG